MADKKISELTGAGALTGTEQVPIVQGGVTVKTTTQDIADLGGSTRIPKTASYTAVNSEDYANNGTITVTDPTGVANLGYTVLVVSGTTTINSVAYTEGDLVYRFFDGTNWESYLINGGGGNFIPLSGTEVGSPVTGDIEFIDGNVIKSENISEGKQSFIGFIDGNSVIQTTDTITGYISNMNTNGIGFEFFSDAPNSRGLVGVNDFTLNITDLDYVQKKYVDVEIKTSSFTALIGRRYNTNGTITITDPTPVANKGYIVFVVSGTTTIDGVGYTANKLVYRFYNGTSWTSTVINGGGASWGGITGTLSDQTDLQNELNSRIKVLYQNSLGGIASHTGDTAETVLLSLDIPANTFKSGDTMGFIIRLVKDTTLGNNTLRTRIGTTGTTSDFLLSTTTVATGGNSPVILAERNRIEFRSGNVVRVALNSQSFNNDLTNGNYGALTSISIDPTILNKFTITAQLGDATATATLDAYQITQIIG